MNDEKSEAQSTTDVSRLVEGCNQFAFDLYSKLAANTSDDVFYSPGSVSFALAMTFAGASGETAREMADVLRFSIPPEQLHEAFRQLQTATKTGVVELQIANRLWGQTGYHFLNGFLQTTEHCYGAKLEEVDFRDSPEEVRQQINAWVEEQTAEKITNLIPPRILGEMTRLVLTNAIYFLGCWENEFDEGATRDDDFRTTDEEIIQVPMMQQTDSFRYGEFDDLQVLEMPYRSRTVEWRTVKHGDIEGMEPVEIPGGGSDFIMCILLPRRNDGLKAIEAQLSSANLQRWTTLRSCDVEVSLPKFRVEAGFQLNEQLQSMGMRQAFSPADADFSRMSDHPEGLFIGTVIHKAFVDVNEKGTEAAAATAIVAMGAGIMEPEPPKQFRVDHPFLFLIRDRETRLIHFMGRVSRPSSSG